MNNLKDFGAKLLVEIILTVIAFLPTAFFLFVKAVLVPNGFWQSVVVYGFGMYFLGAIQIILFIAWVGISFSIWMD